MNFCVIYTFFNYFSVSPAKENLECVCVCVSVLSSYAILVSYRIVSNEWMVEREQKSAPAVL